MENLNQTEYDAKAIARTITVVKDDTQELQDRLSETVSGIAVVQKSVVKATEIRQKQHAEFVALTTQNAGANELLKNAVNRLKKFYTPKLHKAALKAKLSADHRIDVNMGGEITTEAPTQALP